MKAANEAKPAGDATPVIFDTLKAAQELRKTGFEDRQAEAVVETISKAVSETVATKADLQLVRSEMATNADLQLLRSEFEMQRQSVDSRFDKVDSRFDTLEKSFRQDMAAQENRIVIKLGGLMVTMLFVLLAIGPFYVSWVMSLVGTP
ncbi:MAG: hypothetical protein OXN26_02120 [Gammaproteobacteria bacterium]|nr:hypothetical protein [Gammaproteobacteria bacterium]